MKDIQVATGHFRTEYNRFPLPPPLNEQEDAALRSRGAWIAALYGEAVAINPRKIKFFDAPFAKEGKNGLLQEKNEWVLLDRWGEPFYVFFDINYDNRITDPEDPSKFLSNTAVIYSSGPDRDPKTWEDNVRSWK